MPPPFDKRQQAQWQLANVTYNAAFVLSDSQLVDLLDPEYNPIYAPNPEFTVGSDNTGISEEILLDSLIGLLLVPFENSNAVSYTHLTLPTILLV